MRGSALGKNSPDELAFGRAMTEIYQRAKNEAGYTATRFAQMLGEHGGLRTAQMLLGASTPSDGFTALWEADRLDLTVEYHVLSPEFIHLFTPDQVAIAHERLIQYGMKEQQLPTSEMQDPSTQPTDSFDQRVTQAGPVTVEAVRLMDALAEDLDLWATQTHASRKYRVGRSGPVAWIQPKQGKLFFDLRTLAKSNPGMDVAAIHTSLQRLSSAPVPREMAGIPIKDVVRNWSQLEEEVARPFFEATADLSQIQAASPRQADRGTTAGKTAKERPFATSSVLEEISRRRNAIEVGLRQVLDQGLVYEHGKKAASVLLGCLSDRRRADIAGLGYHDMWAALYFNELRDVVGKEWAAFARWFDEDKERVMIWLDHVNRSRVDAHAKSVSEEDLAYLRVCFKRLEESLRF